MTSFLSFAKPAGMGSSGEASAAEEESTPGGPVLDPTLKAVEDMTAKVNPENATLNLRAECSTSAAILFEMPLGETVTVLQKGDTWCKVVYNDQEGYCMTQYLTFPTPAEA